MQPFAFVFFLFFSPVIADIYFHNPRGSNDRNCERNANRNNGNRLFDSQNNNAGGYACPRGVGDESFQSEEGVANFQMTDITGNLYSFSQNKRIYYYSGSVLPLEWTNQHGCGGNSKVVCEIVIQYACEDTLDPQIDDFWPWVNNKAESTSKYRGKQHFRYYDATTGISHIGAPRDGVPISTADAATDTIPDTEASAIASTPSTRRYGMHENFDYYEICQHTQRNMGLYTADQLVRRNDRRGTRQNPNGNRNGLECPEERDYYPHWAPSPWIDVAVLTDSAGGSVCRNSTYDSCTTRCKYYMRNTMNFNKKGYCDVNHRASTVSTKLSNSRWTSNSWYNNKHDCEANNYYWYSISHYDNLNISVDSFVCAHTQFARANQLGNAYADIVSQTESTSIGIVESSVVHGVNANRFMWTVPEVPSPKVSNYFSNMTNAYKSCSLRIRYNISTADFPSWPNDAVDPGSPQMVDYRNNSQTALDPRTPLTQDPYVYIAPGDKSYEVDQFLSLRVNTNQYSRTFQDRSYVFSIKPLPSSGYSDQSTITDSPSVNYDAIQSAIKKGGKIYNVGVRGKRGNIVEVYPSVEYDFVPNALALSENDMIHFQWTGSDYNPQRGCNDAQGGPPDLNTYSTSANADQNSRADRSNVVFMEHMGNNVPRDYLGYDHNDGSLSFTLKQALHNETIASFAPCFNSSDPVSMQQECINSVKWLSYLNQQSDLGSLILRSSKQCLTKTELDNLNNAEVAGNHPLNCAKLNAKPYPYFDGGIMFMRRSGWFPYYCSRNNNFSNRQQIGVICVGSDCKVDNTTGVLQDVNPAVNGRSITRNSLSKCYTTVNGEVGATAEGAMSCLPTTQFNATASKAVLTTETFAIQNSDNDKYGDGNKKGCSVLSLTAPGVRTVEQQLVLAFILLIVGMFTSWLAYYLYNRWQVHRMAEGKFRYDTSWQAEVSKQLNDFSNRRPVSGDFSMVATSGESFDVSNARRMSSRPGSGNGRIVSSFTRGSRGRSGSPSKLEMI